MEYKGIDSQCPLFSEFSHGSRLRISINTNVSASNQYLSAVKITGVDKNTTSQLVHNSTFQSFVLSSESDECRICDSEFEEFIVDAFGI